MVDIYIYTHKTDIPSDKQLVIEHSHRFIVDLPINSMVIFHVNVPQGVDIESGVNFIPLLTTKNTDDYKPHMHTTYII